MHKMKDYDVEVWVHRTEKPLFKWVLNACGAKNAENFARDILSGMTHRVITGADCDEAIGYDLATRMFRVQARLIR